MDGSPVVVIHATCAATASSSRQKAGHSDCAYPPVPWKEKSMKRIFATLAILSVASWTVVAQTAGQPTIKKEAAKSVSSADGPGMFQSYCAPCHGKSGKGDGPASAALKTKPADLTTAAK